MPAWAAALLGQLTAALRRAAALFAAHQTGRVAAERDALAAAQERQDEAAKILAGPPPGRDDILERLRRNGGA